jgi:N-acetylmuramoyl-L-alanine amidase CwlA
MTLEEAFQKLNVVQDFVPTGSSNRPGRRLTPTHITIHNTDNAGPGADARAHARYIKGAMPASGRFPGTIRSTTGW